jgi:hypothetical protein
MKFFWVFLFLASPALASEEHEGHLTKEAIVRQETFQLSQGRAVVIVRSDGHALGHEYVLELRPDCGEKPAADATKLEVTNARSGCKMDGKSLKFDSKKLEISILTYPPDGDDYNKQTMDDPAQAVMHCKTKAYRAVMSVKDICQK